MTTPTTAPLFQLARETFELFEQHADKWQQAGVAQLGESARLWQSLRAQMVTATRNVLATAEKSTDEALKAGAERLKAAGFGGAA